MNNVFLCSTRDLDRQKRTKAIMSGLGSQEGEYRKFLASKKKKKF